VLAVVVSGCRFGFDAGGSAGDASGDTPGTRDTGADMGPLGHDEDGDGIPDATDFCPHIADAINADADGDGVGDVCDPQPTVAQQSWFLFAPMTGAEPFTPGTSATWTMNADDWQYGVSTTGTTLAHIEMELNVDIWVGLTFETLGGTGRQVAVIINGGGVPYWYGELFDGGSNVRASVTEYDGSTYTAKASMILGTSFPLGDAVLHYSAHSGGPMTFTAETTMGTGTATYNGAYAGGPNLYINFGNHSGRVRYIAIIKTT